MDFSKKLSLWYEKNKRSFPWRDSKNPYNIWLSEIILQQTQTKQGLPYYITFTKAFPTVQDLANAKEENVLKLWQGLGYYSRARNLHYAAKYICKELNGVFPKNYKELIQLKGVGDYTASAIASIAFNEKCAVVDGNVYRVLSRYFDIETAINSGKGTKEFKQLATQLLPKTDFGTYNQALMDFGALICTPKKTGCDSCVLNDSCLALQKNKVHLLPVKTSKIKIKKRYFNYLVVISKNKETIIKKRTGKGIWQNLYEFPLIETGTELTITELESNLDFLTFFNDSTINKTELFNDSVIIHKLSHQHLHTNFWLISIDEINQKSIPFTSLDKFPVPTLIHNFILQFHKSIKIN